MLHETFWLTSTDAAPIYVNRWYPAQPPRAVLMVAHGMAEHASRMAGQPGFQTVQAAPLERGARRAQLFGRLRAHRVIRSRGGA